MPEDQPTETPADQEQSPCSAVSPRSYDCPAWLFSRTHQVRFNPNCNRPFQVRLCGKGRGAIYGDNGDAIGHGDSLSQAAELALRKREDDSCFNCDQPSEFNNITGVFCGACSKCMPF